MERDNRLGDFLRARRDLRTPEAAGVAVGGGPRRVPGLRRDELAGLAGVSEAYYIRLERGRDRHPSPQVLGALARALGLDADARAHLHALADGAGGAAPGTPPRLEALPPGLADILERWPGPATAGDEAGVILASNPLARALSPAHRAGTNAYRSLFLDPATRALHAPDWDRVTGEVVAHLRSATGAAPADERLRALVGELAIASPEFRALWARYEVRPRGGRGLSRMAHPVVGPLTVRFEKLAATGHTGLGVVLFSAGPEPADAEALERLRTLTG